MTRRMFIIATIKMMGGFMGARKGRPPFISFYRTFVRADRRREMCRLCEELDTIVPTLYY